MRALADRLDGGLRRAHQLADLPVAEFRVELDQPQDRRRAVLALGQRRVARPAPFFLAHGGGVEFQPQPVQRVFLTLLDLDQVKLVVGDGIKALDARCDIAVGYALHLKLVHAAEFGDLPEGQGRIVHQPDGSCLGHERLVHREHSFTNLSRAGKTAATVVASPRFREVARHIVALASGEKRK